ncbi:MAG: Lon protease family protein [Bacillota bacterium]
MGNADEYRIPLEKLRRICHYEEELDFCNTSLDVPPLVGVIGQERAVRSMQFGLSMDSLGYNIFVVGPSGTGKSTYTRAIVSQVAAKGTVPVDWCYINNFVEYDKPVAVSLPAGLGRIFQKDMEELISVLQSDIPKAFEGNEYNQQKNTIQQSTHQKKQALFQVLEKEAEQANFSMNQTAAGFLFIPLKDGEQFLPEEYQKLPLEQRQRIDAEGRRLGKMLEQTFHEIQMLEKQQKEQIDELEKQIVLSIAAPLINKLIDQYQEFPKIVSYLEIVLKDITDNPAIFNNDQSTNKMISFSAPHLEANPFSKYKVNLFINNEASQGSPVVVESRPSYYNLFGKIEYKSQIMSLDTDFSMVKPGAIHKANGGYLILQAKDILSDPLSWDALKKVLKHREAVVENIGEQYRLVPTVTLRPEPIPLDVKIILIGSPLYYMICSMDEDFRKLFKVKVDFDVEMPRTAENIHHYVSFISALCSQQDLKHFDRSALAKVIEYGSRLAGDQNKLSAKFNEITELVYEATALAQAQGSQYVEASHVDKAISERKCRLSMFEEKIRKQIVEGKILISTEGSIVGQVNALSLLEVGGYVFGQPSRITARTYTGRSGVINIERETDMSGNIHSKGVLILAGYLGGKFAQKKPLGMTAQIAFEQNYGLVDGDSASSAELYAILSSLANVPLRQSLAVTGSVDQHGEIQPIGGVTEKIEGFFDVCCAKGLTGEQGVIIPIQNVSNLMLKDEVLEAVRQRRFHIYAVKNIEEGIEILSGIPAGELSKDGKYPSGSVFSLVASKLKGYNENLSVFPLGALKKESAGDKNKKPISKNE